MLSNLTEIFCMFDDFNNELRIHLDSSALTDGDGSKPRGPKSGLCNSEIMTIMVLYHRSGFKHLKTFYEGVVLKTLIKDFPGAPCYARFIAMMKRVWAPMTIFLHSIMGRKTGTYYIDSTKLCVCDNRRIKRHKVFAGLAERGKTSTGWFFGFKLHLVFNDLREIVAFRVTPGNVDDRKPVPELTKNLFGKIFGDKGYIGKNLAEALLRHSLVFITRVRSNMKSPSLSFLEQHLLNKRNIVETIIGHIKEYSSLRFSMHRSPTNAFTHLMAALISYQINPLQSKPDAIFLP